MANKYLDGNSLLAIRTYIANSIASAISTVYKFKGSKTVAQVNGTADSGNIDYTTIATGDVYNISDSGTITKPTGTSLVVAAGDNIVWDGSTWDKLAGDIDLSAYATQTWVGYNFLPLTGGTLIGTLGFDSVNASIKANYSGVAYTLEFKSTGGKYRFKSHEADNAKVGTFDFSNLTQNRLYELPDNGGTLVLDNQVACYTEQEALAILQSGSLS